MGDTSVAGERVQGAGESTLDPGTGACKHAERRGGVGHRRETAAGGPPPRRASSAPIARRVRGLAFGLDGPGGTLARLEGLLAGGRRRGSAPLERTVLVAAVFLPALLAGAAVGLALWLADTMPPAALSAALSCHH
jgi:hypothetical protein